MMIWAHGESVLDEKYCVGMVVLFSGYMKSLQQRIEFPCRNAAGCKYVRYLEDRTSLYALKESPYLSGKICLTSGNQSGGISCATL